MNENEAEYLAKLTDEEKARITAAFDAQFWAAVEKEEARRAKCFPFAALAFVVGACAALAVIYAL